MKRVVGIGAVLLVALGVWAGRQYLTEQGPILSRAISYFKGSELPAGFASGNGRIEATEYDIATKRAGRIAAVLVAEGDMVQVGQVLARMDTQDLEADLREAQAQATQAREDRRRAVAAIAQRESELRGARPASPCGRAISDGPTPPIAQRRSDLRGADAAIAQREGELALAHKELLRTQVALRQGPDRPPEARRGPDAEADGGSRARRRSAPPERRPRALSSRPRPSGRRPKPRSLSRRRSSRRTRPR